MTACTVTRGNAARADGDRNSACETTDRGGIYVAKKKVCLNIKVHIIYRKAALESSNEVARFLGNYVTIMVQLERIIIFLLRSGGC